MPDVYSNWLETWDAVAFSGFSSEDIWIIGFRFVPAGPVIFRTVSAEGIAL